MNHYFTTELGRIRTEEAIARADRFRLAQQVRQGKSDRKSSGISWSRALVYRRALAAVGLSALMVLGFAAVAAASPMGPGAGGDGVPTDITVTRNHPQVKGENPGQPVRSEHTYGHAGHTTVAGLRAENFVQKFGYYPGAAGVASESSSNDSVAKVNLDAIADLRALNGSTAGSSFDAVAQLRALNQPSVPGQVSTEAIAQLRALNQPSVPTQARIDAVAQLRALNQPTTGTEVAAVGASDRISDSFPLAQTVAVIAGIMVLLAGALMVATRNQQSPKTV
jgi:hypothetical protein